MSVVGIVYYYAYKFDNSFYLNISLSTFFTIQ